jgi:hypothetical protein
MSSKVGDDSLTLGHGRGGGHQGTPSPADPLNAYFGRGREESKLVSLVPAEIDALHDGGISGRKIKA